MFTVESLKKEIADVEFPKNWREGQKVFNYVDQVFGIARYIQFNKGIDCFYKDDAIDDFLQETANVLNEYDKTERSNNQ